MHKTVVMLTSQELCTAMYGMFDFVYDQENLTLVFSVVLVCPQLNLGAKSAQTYNADVSMQSG